MKWIKYQIIQCTVNDEDILATKKVGYSDENLAIAQNEAYNGQYEIIEDDAQRPEAPKVSADVITEGTFVGKVKAQNNTDYVVGQVRNIFLVPEGAEIPVTNNGDIILVYEV